MRQTWLSALTINSNQTGEYSRLPESHNQQSEAVSSAEESVVASKISEFKTSTSNPTTPIYLY
jgi:hypothetical protein